MLLFGYSKIDGGYEGPTEIGTVEEAAQFICSDCLYDKIIVDGFDLPVITTFGWFLDKVDRSKIDFDQLLQAVLKLQQADDEEDEDEF